MLPIILTNLGIFVEKACLPLLPSVYLPVCMNAKISETIRAKAIKFCNNTRIYCINNNKVLCVDHAHFCPLKNKKKSNYSRNYKTSIIKFYVNKNYEQPNNI